MLTFISLASGSSGNSSLISDGETHILIDAGISFRRIAASLADFGISAADVSAVFVTHAHSDHVSGLSALLKNSGAELYTSSGTLRELRERYSLAPLRKTEILPGEDIPMGELTIRAAETPHDLPGSMAFTVSLGRIRFAFATDMGHISPGVKSAVCGSDAVLIEANYDPDMLRFGNYPAFLKRRISGGFGHLSNAYAGVLAASAVIAGTKHIILGHLSRENNTPELAYAAVAEAICKTGAVIGTDVALSVAPRAAMSESLAL